MELFRKFFTFEQRLNVCFDVDTFFFDEFFFSFFRFGNNFISCYFLFGNNLFFGCFCFGNYFLVFVYFYFFSRSSLSVNDILNLLKGARRLLQLVRVVIGSLIFRSGTAEIFTWDTSCRHWLSSSSSFGYYVFHFL